MNDVVPAWAQAAAFAARAHAGQVRKDGVTPYVAHVYRVAMHVRHTFGCEDEATLAAAMLHDTIEDTTTDYEDLAEAFGAEVADLVAALTKNAALPETRREAEYDRGLRDADWRARLIKLGDVLDNVGDSDSAAPDARERVRDRARRAIKLAESDSGSHPEIQRAIETVLVALGSKS